MAIYNVPKGRMPRKPPSGGMANDSGFSKPLPPMTVRRTNPFDVSRVDKSKLENPIYRTPKIEDPPLPPVGTKAPTPKERRQIVKPNPILGRKPVQVVSNIAAPYGSDQTPRVKEGTIYPRNPIPGRNNPRRAPSR